MPRCFESISEELDWSKKLASGIFHLPLAKCWWMSGPPTQPKIVGQKKKVHHQSTFIACVFSMSSGQNNLCLNSPKDDQKLMDSVLPSCANKFGTSLSLDQCLLFLTELFKMEDQLGLNHSLERCSPELDYQLGPAIVHNRQYFMPCTQMELFCLRYIFPLLQIVSLAGNLFNLLVYRLPYFGGSSAVHFLRAKALANLIFVQSRFLESLHAWLPLNATFEWLFWQSRPWLITLGNLNGTVATWLTLLVCAETVICILWPFSFSLRRFFSARCTFLCLSFCVGLAASIHSLYLFTHQIVAEPNSGLVLGSSVEENLNCFRIAHSFMMGSSEWAPWLEKPYYWIQMTLTIMLPTLAMLICSSLILSRFTLKPQLGIAFSQRRKCVIRLTVATAASHLLLEGPSTICYVLFAIRGADVHVHQQTWWICALLSATNVLSALNASIPFFLFLICSSQFRHMSVVYISQQWRGSCSMAAGKTVGTKSQQPKLSVDISQGMPSLRTPSPKENGQNGGILTGKNGLLTTTKNGSQQLLEMLEERRRLLSINSKCAIIKEDGQKGGKKIDSNSL